VAIDLQRIITILELKNIVRVKNHKKQSKEEAGCRSRMCTMSKGLKNQKKQKYHHQNEYSSEACERELKTRRKLEAQNDIAIHLKKT
jgi:hypothetical protein